MPLIRRFASSFTASSSDDEASGSREVVRVLDRAIECCGLTRGLRTG